MTSADNRKNDKQVREKAVDWLLRLEAEPDDQDLADACMRWRQKDRRNDQAFQKAVRAFGDSRVLLRRDIEFARQASQKPDKRRFGAIALTMLLVVAGAGSFIALDGPMRLRADVMSAYDEMPIIRLSDGSTVHLNAHSALKVEIDNTQRRIELLRGEAYFEVAPDPNRPFTVAAANGETVALGTAFDVNLTDNGVDVTVTSHAVEIRSTPSPSLRLEQGFSARYDDSGFGPATPSAPELAAPWRHGRLIFENRPLAQVVDEIARHLPGKVLITSVALAERRISGTFDLKTPEQAFADFVTAFDLKAFKASGLLTILHE